MRKTTGGGPYRLLTVAGVPCYDDMFVRLPMEYKHTDTINVLRDTENEDNYTRTMVDDCRPTPARVGKRDISVRFGEDVQDPTGTLLRDWTGRYVTSSIPDTALTYIKGTENCSHHRCDTTVVHGGFHDNRRSTGHHIFTSARFPGPLQSGH